MLSADQPEYTQIFFIFDWFCYKVYLGLARKSILVEVKKYFHEFGVKSKE